MTKRGEQIVIVCAGCGEEYPYTYDRGRIRRYHPDDFKGPDDKLTRCRWRYSNNEQRVDRAAREKAERTAAIDAEVDARVAEEVRAKLGLRFTDQERHRLLNDLDEVRSVMAMIYARDRDQYDGERILADSQATFERNVVPLLGEIEALLRRT